MCCNYFNVRLVYIDNYPSGENIQPLYMRLSQTLGCDDLLKSRLYNDVVNFLPDDAFWKNNE
jgi:hypothetical protein